MPSSSPKTQVIYREKNPAALASVLNSYYLMAEATFARPDKFYKGYRTAIETYRNTAESTTDNDTRYNQLLAIHNTLDSINISRELYDTLQKKLEWMQAEITKISPSIPLIVALIASAVGFGAQCVLRSKINAFVIKLIPFFIYFVFYAYLLEVFINPFGWHSEWHKLSAVAAGLLTLIGLSGIIIAWCVYGIKRPNRGYDN